MICDKQLGTYQVLNKTFADSNTVQKEKQKDMVTEQSFAESGDEKENAVESNTKTNHLGLGTEAL